MADIDSAAWRIDILVHWGRERLIEILSGNVGPASFGLKMPEATMAMAAVRHNMAVAKRMISLGADPSVKNFLVYRMASGAGDLKALAAIEAISSPTICALMDALAWARENDRPDAVDHLLLRIAAIAMPEGSAESIGLQET